MLNFGFVFEDKDTAYEFTFRMAGALVGVPAFCDEENTILVPMPEKTDDGRWVAMISIGTSDQTSHIQWMAVNYDRGVLTKEEFDDLRMIEEQAFGQRK